jgi:hypothetical protein
MSAHGDDEIGLLYTGPGVVEAWFENLGPVDVLFNEGRERPGNDGAGGIALLNEDVVRYIRGELPGMASGLTINVDGTDYLIREVRKLNRLEDEAVVVAA